MNPVPPPKGSRYVVVKTYAAATLAKSPWWPHLVTIYSEAKQLGIATTIKIPAGTRLGQYRGRIIPIERARELGSRSAYVLEARPATGREEAFYAIDAREDQRVDDLPTLTFVAGYQFTAEDQQPSWTRYINSIDPEQPASAQNVQFVFDERDGRVYIDTIREILPGEEILTYYGKGFFYVNLSQVTYDSVSTPSARRQLYSQVANWRRRSAGDDERLYNLIVEPFNQVTVLFERDDLVAAMVWQDSSVYWLETIEVRNVITLKNILLSLVHEWAFVNGRNEVLAVANVFESLDAYAAALHFVPARFGEARLQVGTVQLYRRHVSPLAIRDVVEDDVALLFQEQPNIACPELRSKFTVESFRPGRRGSTPLYRMRVASVDDLITGVIVEPFDSSSSTHYVVYVCTFRLNHISDITRAYTLERLVDDYERRLPATALTARLFVAVSNVNLMAERIDLIRYRQTTPPRGRTAIQTIVNDAVFYTRPLRATRLPASMQRLRATVRQSSAHSSGRGTRRRR